MECSAVWSDFEHSLAHIQDAECELLLSRLYGLSDLRPDEQARLQDAWSHIQVHRRRRTVQALIELAEASFMVDFRAIFRLCLQDEDGEVRALAINGLWEDRDRHVASRLVQLLREDPVPAVRAAAATVLGSSVLRGELEDWAQAAKVREALFETLASSQEPLEVRRRSLESVAYASDGRVAPLIEAAYHDEEAKMRVSAVFAMGRSVDPRWARIVLRELHSSDPEMRYEATRACGELQLGQAVPRLEELTRDGDREVQETAIWALGQIGGREARRILEACYDQADESVCEEIDEALAALSLSDESFGLAYRELLDDKLQDLAGPERRSSQN